MVDNLMRNTGRIFNANYANGRMPRMDSKIIRVENFGLSGICRDRPAYLAFGVRRIANPPHIWRYITPIPNESNFVCRESIEKG